MIKNVGKKDKFIRMTISLLIAGLYYFGALDASGILSFILLVIALIIGITAVMRFCPIYRLVGISTCPAEK